MDQSLDERDGETERRIHQLPREVGVALGTRTRDQTDAQGHFGQHRALVLIQETLRGETGDEFLAPTRHVAQESLDVHVRDRKPNLALGGVEIDVAVEADDHARLQDHALVGQSAL